MHRAFLFCSMIPNLISIIMPVKNEESYLEECLDSIIAQDYKQWELLMVDDFSSDSTWSIMERYQEKDERINIFKTQKPGIIPALREAYSHSHGNYITRMDADDLMPLKKLSTLVKVLKEREFPTLATGMVKYFSEEGVKDGYLNYQKWLNTLCKKNSHYQEIYKECVIPSPCWMTDRVTFDRCGAFDSVRYPEDYDLAFRFYEQNIKVKGISKILHYWRDYPSRTSRTDSNYSDNRFLKLKIHYFLKIDYRKEKPLYLWGAGKKGKQIADLLNKNEIPFSWISNNPKKIGRDIYGQIIKADTTLPNNTCNLILAIANEKEKDEALRRLYKLDHKSGETAFSFC